MSASYLDEPADVRAEPGSKTWARGIAAKIKFSASKLEFDVSSVQEWIQIAVEHDAWKVLGYASLDVFLVSETGITQDFIDAIRNAKKGTTVGDAVKAAKDKPLPKHGGDRKSEQDQGDNVTLKDRGNATDYTLRRLARDAPEFLDKIETGELSINAAAIAAGIRKKPSADEQALKCFRKADNRMNTLQKIVGELQPHEVELLRQWISEASQ